MKTSVLITYNHIFPTESETITALRCLSFFFLKTRKKRPINDSEFCVVPSFLMEGMVSSKLLSYQSILYT